MRLSQSRRLMSDNQWMILAQSLSQFSSSIFLIAFPTFLREILFIFLSQELSFSRFVLALKSFTYPIATNRNSDL